MNSDFFQPAKPLADKVNCLTLTKQFFQNNKVNTSKKELLRSFTSYKEIPIQYMDQVHGYTSQVISSYSSMPIERTDALFSSTSNLALATLSADCVPITLSKRDGSEFAIIHAGWKGLVSGVIESCISSFTNDNNISAWIGPAISAKNYEVEEDVYNSFLSKDKDSKSSFYNQASNKWLLDLQGEAKRVLEKFKIQVQCSDICTFDSELLYSYRKEQTEHRIVTIIWRDK